MYKTAFYVFILSLENIFVLHQSVFICFHLVANVVSQPALGRVWPCLFVKKIYHVSFIYN